MSEPTEVTRRYGADVDAILYFHGPGAVENDDGTFDLTDAEVMTGWSLLFTATPLGARTPSVSKTNAGMTLINSGKTAKVLVPTDDLSGLTLKCQFRRTGTSVREWMGALLLEIGPRIEA